MKLILCQPAIPRFQWELDVLLANIRQFTDIEAILLFSEHDFTVPAHFRKKAGCRVFVYEDRRDHTDYIPSIRPYLLWQYFKEDPAREAETYFYIDSDVIFRAWPHFATLGVEPGKVIGSSCDGYIGLAYIEQCENGPAIAQMMAETCGITVEQMRGVPGIGAHLLLPGTTAAFWERSYRDSCRLHDLLGPIPTNLQKWTAEMWAQLWGWVREGLVVEAPAGLDFATATDPVERWNEVNIMHNSGVTPDRSHELFYKGQYVNHPPFGKNFGWVRRDKCSWRYVEALEKVLS